MGAVVLYRRYWAWLLGAYAVLVAAGLWLRPLLPVDETRYLTVAWEMWARGDWLLPHLNAAPYDHKPPLLFWLIHAGWAVFGVNEWWPRLLGPLLALMAVAQIARLASRLWPERLPVVPIAPAVFLGAWFVALFSTALMFDMLLLTCVLGAWLALWSAAADGRMRDLAAVGGYLGLGLLAKGPVALVYVVPLALALPWWSPRQARTWLPRRWIGGLFLATAIALSVAGLWILAVAQFADGTYMHRILWDQTAARISGATGHGRPFWWYLPVLPVLALPWLVWPPAWRAARLVPRNLNEPGVRFCVAGLGLSLGLLSIVGGKQVHYLIPLVALASLLMGRMLVDALLQHRSFDDVVPALLLSPLLLMALVVSQTLSTPHPPEWIDGLSLPLIFLPGVITLYLLARSARRSVVATVGLASSSLLYLALLVANAFLVARPYYDLRTTGAYLGDQQRAGRPIAFVGSRYQGEFGFYGRLLQPIAGIEADAAAEWVADHPDGLVVVRRKRVQSERPFKTELDQPYKTDELYVLSAAEVLSAGIRFVD